MKTNRRIFISTAAAGGLGAAALSLSGCRSEMSADNIRADIKSRYARLDEILKQPVLKRELFTSPVIIESLELLIRKKLSVPCEIF